MTKPRFPAPLTLLVGCLLLAAILSYILPAGEYDQADDPATGRSEVFSHDRFPTRYSPYKMKLVAPYRLSLFRIVDGT